MSDATDEGRLALASAARRDDGDVELVVVPYGDREPRRYVMGEVVAASLRLLLDDALGER